MAKNNMYSKEKYLDIKGHSQPRVYAKTQKRAKELYLENNPNKKVYDVTKENSSKYFKENGVNFYRITGVSKDFKNSKLK